MNINFRDIYQKQDNNKVNTEFLKAGVKLQSKYQGGEVTHGELTSKDIRTQTILVSDTNSSADPICSRHKSVTWVSSKM